MDSGLRAYVIPIEKCLENFTYILPGSYCNVTSDFVTCWPPTEIGKVAKQPCPAIFGSYPGTFAYKRCNLDGTWAETSKWKGFGHSDYSECIGHLSMIEDVFGVEKDELKETINHTKDLPEDKTTNIIILVTLIVSLLFLVMSFVAINCLLPRKINQSASYKIWKHFLSLMIMEVLLMATLEIVYFLLRKHNSPPKPAVCETLITCIEYLNTAGYMWFMIQTHLHQLSAKSERLCTSGYITYIVIGWGIPAIPTTIWSVSLSLSYGQPCWTRYESQPIIWILEAAHMVMLLVAVIFLIKTFIKISSNSEMLNTNCCYRRLYLEAIGSALFAAFMLSVIVLNIVSYTMSSVKINNKSFVTACHFLSAFKGIVLSMLMLSFNTDIRGLIGRTVRRISRHELISSSVEENEV